MFCSSCGRTLLIGDTQCRHCGAPVGESIFMGIPYTSAQTKLLPGDELQTGVRAFTRVDYGDAEEREALTGDAAPETGAQTAEAAVDVPAEADAPAAEGAEETPEKPVYGEETEETPQPDAGQPAAEEASATAADLSDLKARPIASRGQSGISSDVSEYMQKLESGRSRRANRRKQRDGEQPAEDAAPETVIPAAPVYGEPDDADAYEEEEIEERRHLSGAALQALKIAGLLVVLAALVVGGVFWVRHVRESSKASPIEGVAPDLYEAGIEMIGDHADTTYVQSLLDVYSTDGILTLTQRLDADAQAITDLTPEEASVADSQFVNALKSIQSNITNAVTMDALAIAQPADDTVATSNARWAVINGSIQQLKAATSTQQLEAIINGERIQIQTAAPTATPTPTQYTTLTRGDKSEEVRQMQERLWQLGFLQDVRDGNFGGNTYTAVKTFQQAAGLDVTGIADSKTLTALYADDAPITRYAQPGVGATATPAAETSEAGE